MDRSDRIEADSRLSSRGPLIAVIKIQIDAERTDRIFLHQHDDDHQLALDFVLKHGLSPTLVQHLYQRIIFSRQSFETDNKQIVGREMEHVASPTPFNCLPGGQQLKQNNGQGYKIQTPIQMLERQQGESIYEQQQSFGNVLPKRNNMTHIVKKSSNLFNQEMMPSTGPRINHFDRYAQDLMQAPAKQDKRQFLFYGQNEEQDRQANQPLFPVEQTYQSTMRNIKQVQNIKPFANALPAQIFRQEHMNDTRVKNISRQPQKAINQNIKQEMRGSQSMTKLRCEGTDRTVKQKEYDKPTHVKIIKKEELASLNQSLKRSMSKQEISRINQNVTRRLYNEAEIKKNYLNIIKEKAKKQKELADDVQLTYRPEINNISKVIAQGRKKSQIPVQMYLIEEGKKAESKRMQEANRQSLKQIQNCSFQPVLNLISQKLAADRGKLQSRLSETLCRKSAYDSSLFHPSLNKVTQQLMKDKGKFQDRQRQYLQQKNSRLVDLVKQRRLNEKIDRASGQQLFKPKINDLGVRESQGSNIGNYLYQLGKQGQSNVQASEYKLKINDSSEQLVQQMYFKRVAWLFSELDSDQDGVISAHSISIDKIPAEVLDIIKPILFQMQQMGEELSLIQFKNAVEILHRKLNAFQKSILYNYKQKIIKQR